MTVAQNIFIEVKISHSRIYGKLSTSERVNQQPHWEVNRERYKRAIFKLR